jgi:hypothetical protein
VRRWWLVALVAGVGGVAGVLGAFAAAKPTQAACWELPQGEVARSCYIELLAEDLATDPEPMFATARRLLDDPVAGPHFILQCHEAFHELGKQAERRNLPVDLDTTPLAWCVNGLAHGILDVRFENLSDAELVARATTLCAGIDEGICRHMIGHVTFRRTQPDLELSFAVCQAGYTPLRTRVEALAQLRCLDGAYMERTLWMIRSEDPFTGTVDEALKACRDAVVVGEMAQQSCYYQVGALLYTGVRGDLPAMFTTCAGEVAVGGEASARLCTYSASKSIFAFAGEDLDLVAQLCGGIERELDCVVGFELSRRATDEDTWEPVVCRALRPVATDECVAEVVGPLPFEFTPPGSSTPVRDVAP